MTWTALRDRSARDAFAWTALLDLLVRSGVVAKPLAPVASLLAGTAAAGTTLADVTTWLVFALGFYLVTPVVYPRETGFPRTRRGFRLLFAATAVSLGVTLSAVSRPAVGLAGLAVGLAAGYAAFLAYLRLVRG